MTPVLVSGVLWATTAQGDITTGLVGYWPLNGDALDASGNDLHGTINGKATPVKSGAGRIYIDDIQLLRPIPAKL